MKTNISPALLLRIPVYSLSDQLSDVWDELKVSISHSSKAFYENIKEVEAADLPNLDFKLQFTIWKYFNRSRFRGTPYGSFAGFAFAELKHQPEALIISEKQHLHCFKDWSLDHKDLITDEDLIAPQRFYLSNSSTYSTTKSIRFISLQDKVFELDEIEHSAFIAELLAYCSNKVSYHQLYVFAEEKEIEEEVLHGVLKAMIELQLLFTDLDRNIIGTDYYERTGHPYVEGEDTYLIAERKVLSGAVDRSILQHLPSCIDYLVSKQDVYENEDLNRFKNAFMRRFEYQQIPLMQALDPELGIGYGELEGISGSASLINELVGGHLPAKKTQISNTAFAHHLLREIINGQGDKEQVIRLEQDQTAATSTTPLEPANSFSALVRLAGDLLVIDNIGGCTGTALAGRFTMASEDVEQHCKNIAAIESAANPDVIFFDLAYMAEGRVDNVNRRKSVYDYELPILNYSCSAQPVQLNDLLVTVKNGEVILTSVKYQKRVIPRLASAYNYSRSDLSVYRFLCDLQHQGIQSQLLFDVESLLPELDFYPRIQFKSIVLSTAKWKVRSKDFRNNNIREILTRFGISRYFSVGNGDQTLCFDQQQDDDLLYFKQYLGQNEEFMITEVIISDKQLINDVSGKAYFTQILVTLSHNRQLYDPCLPALTKFKEGPEKVIVPGKDWLYLEIYSHAQRADSILAGAIMTFVHRYSTDFKTWFFIRYNDPAPHLRLRLQLQDAKQGYFYIAKLMELLSDDLEAGIISDIQLKTYKREIWRYGHQQIEITEQHFASDSEYALNAVAGDLDTFDHYANCISLMKTVLAALTQDRKQQLTLVKTMQQSFEKEHQLDTDDFKKINKEWSGFIEEYPVARLEHSLFMLPGVLIDSFVTVLDAAKADQRETLCCDLFHMHINRLFAADQRAHEMIIYTFLHKHLLRETKKLNHV